MAQQEVQERNKQIALMLGWKEYKPERNWFWGKKKMTYYKGFDKVTWSTPRVYVDYFKFHSDWNWLMEAIRFIQKKSFDITIDFFSSTGILKTDAFVSKNSDIIIESLGKEDIEAMFEIVSDFAKLYNEKKL
jgi:hypothetical protein